MGAAPAEGSWTCATCGTCNSQLTPDFCPACGSYRDDGYGHGGGSGGYSSDNNRQQRQRESLSSGGARGAEGIEDPENGDYFINDESIWSEAGSITTATSLPPGEANDMVLQELVTLLWGNQSVHNLFIRALEGNRVSADQLERKFRRLLKRMASSLRDEAKDLEQRRASKLVAISSRAVSSLIRKRAEDESPLRNEKEKRSQPAKIQLSPLRDDMQIYGSSSEDETDDEEDQPVGEDERNQLSRVRGFITQSSAFTALCKNLESFVHPTLRSMLLDFIERPKKDTSDPAQQTWVTAARTLATELRDVDPSLISISREHRGGHVNALKIRVEDLTREKWNWWPLSPAWRPTGKDEMRIRWTCVSETNRY